MSRGVEVVAVAVASFAPEPISARQARRFLRAFLDDHHREELTGNAQLALSEIVTNAVLHAHTDIDVSAALAADGSLRVEVADRNPQLPVQRDYTEEATTGRGMELVAAVTTRCGVEARGPAGKAVWFVVQPDAAASSDAVRPDRWGIDMEQAATSAAGSARIVLLDMPAVLWLAAREHHDAIVRELVLYGQEHPGDVPDPERLALADQARAWISTRLLAALGSQAPATAVRRQVQPRSGRLVAAAPPRLDLTVWVPREAATAFDALQDVLDTAERLALGGQLLARPALPEIVAVRDWASEQVIAQLTGVPPSPWPGTGQQRFTVEVRDRDRPRHPDWDVGVVRDAARGAVAADDANRIIAVSQSLASALGWTVEDLVGRRLVALVPPELREAHVAGFTRHLATGQTRLLGVPLRLPVLRADGRRVECDVLIEQSPATTGRAVYIAWMSPVEQRPDAGGL